MTFRTTELSRPIPYGVTHLDLSRNLSIVTRDLVRMLHEIPPTIVSLDLSFMYLAMKTEEEIIHILRAIPAHVTALDLSNNYWFHKTAKELVRILGAIPSSITSLDLSGDTFYAKKEEECNHILSAIPPFVTSLDLRGCNMGYRTRDSIIYLLNTIPPSVTSLNLGGTGLMNKTVRELEFISRSLKHIICIEAYDLLKEQLAALNRYNGFHGKKAIHQALDRHLGGDLSSLVLEYSTSSSPKDIRNILITQEAHKSYVTSIKTTIMHATKSGAPIVLGLLAGFCVYYFREPSSQSVFSVP